MTVVNQAGAYVHEYNIKDHLGNTRVTYSDANNDGVLVVSDMKQINHYYPFGLNMEGNWNGAAGSNKYGYNGKEWNDDFGLGLNDYGARWYASDAPRWINIDPLGELRANLSPYQYVQNNPINAIDPTGMLDESFYKGSGASFDDKYMKSKGERMSEEGDKWRNEGQSTFKWSPYGTKTYDSGGNLLNTTIDGYNVTKDCGCGGTGQPPCPTEKTGNLIEDIKNSLIYGFKAGGWVVKETSSKLDAEVFQDGGRKLLNGEYGQAGTSIAMALVFRGSSRYFMRVYKHAFKYAARVRLRGVQDPVSHNFPYSFDDVILSNEPILKENGYKIFQQPGIMNAKNGVFEIGVTKDGIIDHRFFRPINN